MMKGNGYYRGVKPWHKIEINSNELFEGWSFCDFVKERDNVSQWLNDKTDDWTYQMEVQTQINKPPCCVLVFWIKDPGLAMLFKLIWQ